MERIHVLVLGLALLTLGLGVLIRSLNSMPQLKQGREDENLCFPALFSFGSSVAETGTHQNALPSGEPKELLYGSTFFGKHSKRYTDGRMHIDFWASALKLPFLDPYLKSVGSNFRRGVNFAAASSTALNVTPVSPFHLSIQLNQFREFKHDVLALLEEQPVSACDVIKLPLKQYFEDALYMVAMGSNDIIFWILQGLSLQEVESRVPEISKEIIRVAEALHAEGARYILVDDVYPEGCVPSILTLFAEKYPDQLDDVGCLKPFNDLVQLHNAFLKQGIAELSKRLPNASIAVVDTYSIRYDIIANHHRYGFKDHLRACCGTGGEYNFRPDCYCGCRKVDNGVPVVASICDNVSSYVWWDGSHFTDAFNHVTMKAILKGEHFKPSFDLIQNGCDLAEI